MNEELKLDELEQEVPTLTLNPEEEKKAEPVVVAPKEEIQPVRVEDTPLSDEEQQVVDDFAEKIDVTNSQMVLQYGAAAQKKISAFSEAALEKVRTQDLGETGDMLTQLVTQLQNFDASEKPKGFLGIFKKARNSVETLKARYAAAETNVEKIEVMLEEHQVQLMKDISMMDKLYELNLRYFKELSMYILAGKKKLTDVREGELKAALEKAQASGLPEDAQAARDLSDMCDRFEKKIYDLELTRNISLQLAPQIRLLQNNDSLMAEKIQTSMVNTIPLWKNQMVLSLGLAHTQQAIEAQRAVSDMTNQLLQKNAEALKMGTTEAARESERGIVDIETLKNTNRALIETLDELSKIQSEGRQKRAAAEEELGRIEGELKQKLLELH